jgi:hypothetical protein
MAEEDSFLYPTGNRAVRPEDDAVDWADWAKGIAAGAVNTAAGGAALTEYVTDGKYGGETRRYLDKTSEGIMDTTSPAFRRSANAAFLPGEGERSVWDEGIGRSIASKTIMATPSIVASIVPAGLVGAALRGASVGIRAGAAGATARGTGGALNAGDVANDIFSRIEGLSEEDLQRSDLYRGYLSMGMSPQEAREAFMQDAADYRPLVAGAISALLGGVEGQIGRRLGGEAARGVFRGAARGAGAEALQESAESGSGEFLSQDALATQGLADRDWLRVLSSTIEGGVVGGVMGGAAGGLGNIRREPAKPRAAGGVEMVETLGGDAAQTVAAKEALGATATPQVSAPAVTAPAPAAPPPAAPPPAQAAQASTETTVPEPAETLQSQIKDLADGRRPAVLLPKDLKTADRPPRPNGDFATYGIEGVGTFYYDPKKVSARQLRAAAREGRLNEVLGMASTSKVDAAQAVAAGAEPGVVQVRDEQGTPKVEAATSSATVAQDASQIAAQAAPTDTVQITTPEAVIAERKARRAAKPAPAPAAAPPVPPSIEEVEADPSKNPYVTEPVYQPEEGTIPGAKLLTEGDNPFAKREPATSQVAERPKRVLESVTPDATAIQIATREQQELNERDMRNQRRREQRAAAGPVGDTNTTRVKERNENSEKAAQAIQRFPADEAETQVAMSKGQKAADREARQAARNSIQARARAMVNTAVELGYQFPERVKAAVAAKNEPAVRFLQTARALANSPNPKSKLIEQFLNDERLARGGTEQDFTMLQEAARQQAAESGKLPNRGQPVNAKNEEVDTGEESAGVEDLKSRQQTEDNLLTAIEMKRQGLSEDDTAAAEAITKEPEEAPKPRTSRSQPATFKRTADEYAEIERRARRVTVQQRWAARNAERKARAEAKAKKVAAEVRRAAVTPQVDPQQEREAAIAKEASDIELQLRSAGVVFAPERLRAMAEKSVDQRAKDREDKATREREAAESTRKDTARQTRLKVQADTAAEWEKRLADEGLLAMSAEEAGLTELDEHSEVFSDRGLQMPTKSRVYGATVLREATAADVLDRLDLSAFTLNNAPVLRAVAGKLREFVGKTKVYVISDAHMRRINYNWAGFYHPTFNYVVVRESEVVKGPRRWAHVVLHELVHAATIDALKNDPQVRADAELIFEHLLNIHGDKLARDVGIDRDGTVRQLYGFSNVEEMLAEALSNSQFQRWLGNTRLLPTTARQLGLKNPTASIWQGIVQMVRFAFGLKPDVHSALEGIMDVAGRAFEANGRPRSFGHISSDLAGIDASALQQEATQQVKASTTNLRGRLRRAGDYLSTTMMLARRARDLFTGTDAPDRVANINEMIRTYKDRYLDKPGGGTQTVGRLAELQRKYGAESKEWGQFADLAHDLTVNNVNVGNGRDNTHLGQDDTAGWQAKERLPDLERRFDELPEDLQRALVSSSEFFRTTQNDESRQLINNILDAAGLNQPGLADKIMDNGLTEEEADKLGIKDTPVTRALRDARSLRSIGGMYFPLMRRGNFVVNGRVSFDTPTDALRVDDETVQFVSLKGSDAKARKKARNFVRGHDLTALDVRKVWVDKNDPSEIIPAEDVDAVPAYRVRLQTQHTQFVETEAEAQAVAKELTDSGIGEVRWSIRQNSDGSVAGELTPTQMRTLVNSLQQRKGFKDLSDGGKRQLVRALEDATLRLMASNRLQTKRIPRRNVAGYSTDVLTNAAQYAQSAANYMAQLVHAPKLNAAMKDMRDYIKKYEEEKDNRHNRRRELYNELERRVYDDSADAPPTTADNAINRLLQASSLARLAGVSYHLINSLEPGMVALPYLSGRHNPARVMAAMTRAYNRIGARSALGSGLRDTWHARREDTGFTNYVDLFKQSMRGDANAARYGELLDRLHDIGLLDREAGFEVQRQANPAGNALGRGLDRATLMSRQVGAAIEAINRSVVALTAYDLEMTRPGATHESAMRYAEDAVHDTAGNYSTSNAAPIFNSRLGRATLQFKKFAQKMYYLLGSIFGRMLRGDREAMRQFAGIMATHMVMAGALALPLEPIKVALMAGGFLGIAPFSYDDLEAWARNAASGLGPTAGEMLTRGLPRFINIDISSRVGLDSLLTFGEPRSNKAADIKAYLFDTLAGAPIGLVFQGFEGVRALVSARDGGDLLAAAEKLSPVKAVTDVVRAARGYTEGKVSATGRQTMEPLSGPEAALKAIGLRTGREAETTERRDQYERQRRAVDDERKKIVADWVTAKPADRQRMWGRVEKFNTGKPKEAQLSRSSLDQAVKRRERERETGREVDGLRTGPRDKYILDQLQFYNVR